MKLSWVGAVAGFLFAICPGAWSADAVVPAVWQKHVLIVDLHDLPKHYSCDDLWYKFKDVLRAVGAAPEMNILPYECDTHEGSPGYSPKVQLNFSTLEPLKGTAARWATVRAVTRPTRVQPEKLSHIDDEDCVLLSQIRSTLLVNVDIRVTSFNLACQALSSSHPQFGLTVEALVPVTQPAAAGWQRATASATEDAHYSAQYGCEFGYRRVGNSCIVRTVPAHAYLSALGDDWSCERGFRRNLDHCVNINVPVNAHLTDAGWDCNRGYVRSGHLCQAIRIPAHGFALYGTFDSGWDCDRGYIRKAQSCVQVNVPPHAFLNATGDDWTCGRGFGQKSDHCVALVVPQNAHLDESGHDWQCDRGYRQSGGSCVVIRIPPHAYALWGTAEETWRCERGFTRNGDSCLPVLVPAHAYLNDSGDGWKCERGFQPLDNACEAIMMPAHAHLDSSGNQWTCNWGYEAHDEQCTAATASMASIG